MCLELSRIIFLNKQLILAKTLYVKHIYKYSKSDSWFILKIFIEWFLTDSHYKRI